MPDLSVNRRARFDYEILETYEAGMALLGFEVKSAKAGRMQIAGAFVVIKNNEPCPHTKHHERCGVGAWLLSATIPPYQVKNTPERYDPARSRRLLLRKSQINELIGKSAQKGLTMVPLRVYTKRNRVKLLLGIARHKKTSDKRETIKKREAKREIDRTLKRG